MRYNTDNTKKSPPGRRKAPENGEKIMRTITLDAIKAMNASTFSVQAEQQEQPTTADILHKAANIIETRKDRSAWNKGVNAYALELLDNLAELAPDDLATPEAVRRALLNGADTWERYSYGGCSLIYDCDIAARLCTPSELRRCKGGDLNPNSRETWLDVQARALFQAACSVRLALCAAVKEVRA